MRKRAKQVCPMIHPEKKLLVSFLVDVNIIRFPFVTSYFKDFFSVYILYHVFFFSTIANPALMASNLKWLYNYSIAQKKNVPFKYKSNLIFAFKCTILAKYTSVQCFTLK